MHAKNGVRLAILICMIVAGLFNLDRPIRITNTSLQPALLSKSPSIRTEKARALEAYGKLPIRFEANAGQTADQVKFLSRGSGYNLLLTSNEAILALSKSKSKNQVEPGPVIKMKFAGANPEPQLEGLGAFSGRSNYFIGNDPSKWRRDVLNYEKIRYRNIYPGTDLVYYGNQQQIEYDFVVTAGADPNLIKLDFDGVSQIRVDDGGDLVLNAGENEVRQHKAVVYQEVDGRREEIASRYLLGKGGEVSFEIGAYDRSRPLVIDPVLSYSTFLGRNDDESANAIYVDEAGNAYVTGYTFSLDFPTEAPLQVTNSGNGDAFVIKLNPAGSDIIFSTFLGGSDDFEQGDDIALDEEGNIFLAGPTQSNDFPTVNAIQPAFGGGGQDFFVAKLASDGSRLIFSTYLGGGDAEYSRVRLAVDGSGDVCVTGNTQSINFPTANAFQPVHAPGRIVSPFPFPFPSTRMNQDAIVTKIKGDGSALSFSTYLGGSGDDRGLDLAIDGNGDIHLVGFAGSIDFPTADSLQPKKAGAVDAFISKFDRNGSLIFSTYFGGSSSDYGQAISLDGAGNIYLLGDTYSTNFPTLSPLDSTLSGSSDLFVAKLNPTASAILYSTYLGGSNSEEAADLKVDATGNAYITGLTSSNDFPTVNAIQTVLDPGSPCPQLYYFTPSDAIIAKLDALGSRLIYSSYLGGQCSDRGEGIAIDRFGSAYVVGSTASANFPTTPGAFQTIPYLPQPSNIVRDAFILKIGN
jgi:Beta-propeller repeat